MAWSVLRYTDPDVALAQADVDDGVLLALQIDLRLGTAAYATMALREVTKTDTGSHHQMALTQASEDQKYRGYEEEVNN